MGQVQKLSKFAHGKILRISKFLGFANEKLLAMQSFWGPEFFLGLLMKNVHRLKKF